MICTGDPAKSISAVTWPFKDGVQLPFTLFALADRLRTRGWLVPAYTLPAVGVQGAGRLKANFSPAEPLTVA